MRIGFHYHMPAEVRDGVIWMPSPQGCFINSLAMYADEVVCFLHTARLSRRDQLDYRLTVSNVVLIDIGPHCAAWKRSLFSSRYVAPLDVWQGKLDVLLTRGPSPLLPAFCKAAQRNGIATALLLVGSYVDGVGDLPQPRWRKELIRLFGRINQYQQVQAARQSLTFVNSRKLYDELHGRIPYLVETRTTTLSKGDFFERDDTCLTRPIRLLYTGRFDRGKGLLEMVEALAQLVEKGNDIVLDLVGWPEPGDNVINELMLLAERLGVAQRVINHGRKVVGPELFAYYRQADIYLLASKSNFEGFPRTIWEAMAHSLPVVATRVGSIAHFIDGSAELIEPGSVLAIVEGVERLLSSSERRKRIIKRAMTVARENTLERRSREMIETIELWQKREVS